MSQFERICYIDRLLREDHILQCREVATRFEVSERQVKRDIEYLRDRLDAPIVYDRAARKYRYARPFNALLFADEKLLIFSALLRSLVLNEHFVPVVTPDLLRQVEQQVSRDYRVVSERIKYETPVAQAVVMEDFTIICQAMAIGRRLDISYENVAGERTNRQIEPQRLINYSGRWYLIAFDLLREDLRTFHLSRVTGVSVSRRKTTRVPSRTAQNLIDRYIASGFGIFNGPVTKTARIRIYGTPAAAVSKQVWHPQQKVVTGQTEDYQSRPTPYTDLIIPVSDWREILGRVLSFGSAAEAMEPEEFRTLWEEEIQKMADLALRRNATAANIC